MFIYKYCGELYHLLTSFTFISINNYEGYRDLLNKDLIQFEKLQKVKNLLIGERGRIGKIILDNQLSYYKDELKGALSSLATRYGIKILLKRCLCFWKNIRILLWPLPIISYLMIR